MLVNCPECDASISDRAYACPHCGFPMKQSERQIRAAKPNKRRRLPNGFGRITKINNNDRLRNPYRAMVSIGHNREGRSIGKILGYYPTYNDAYTALVEYNARPYELRERLTVQQAYEKWYEEYSKTVSSTSSLRTVESAWAYCSGLYRILLKDLRASDIKACMDGIESPNTKSRVKSIFNLMLDYALEYEYIDKNVARTFKISDSILKEREQQTHGHISFSEDEMNRLWEAVGSVPYVDVVLIQCYGGWRPQELGLIELKNVDLENWTIIGGMKTDAGKNRLVPIHSAIRDLVKARYDEAVSLGSQYLINCVDAKTHTNSKKLTYDKYHHRFRKIVDTLELKSEHRAHDCRKQFVTMGKNAGMDEYAIKRIVGHVIEDITEKVYTDRDANWLSTEIEKIKGPES